MSIMRDPIDAFKVAERLQGHIQGTDLFHYASSIPGGMFASGH